MTIELDLHEYEALVRTARDGVLGGGGDAVDFENFLAAIDRRNAITRSVLCVLWSETGESLPEGARFPDAWPASLSARIEQYSRPVARADVERVLSSRARKAARVFVTRDVEGRRGWTSLDDFFPPGV